MLCVMLVLCGRTMMAQDAAAQDAPPAVFYPASCPTWDVDAAIGLRVLTVPRDIAEEEINRAPLLELQAVMGLPLQFSLRGGTTLQFITNHFRLGFQWSHRIGDLGVGVWDDWAYWFCLMNYEGFDNTADGLINYRD